MAEILNNQGGASGGSGMPRATFPERLDKFSIEQNDWKRLNGSVQISADIDATLEALRGVAAKSEGVSPSRIENLPANVRTSVKNYSVTGNFEQIWRDMIAKGADTVKVVDGVFGFYSNGVKLHENNKPLRIPAMPLELQMIQEERRSSAPMQNSRLARQMLMAELRVGRAGTVDAGVDQSVDEYAVGRGQGAQAGQMDSGVI